MMEKMESKEGANSFSQRKDQGDVFQRGGWPAGITFCLVQVADTWVGAAPRWHPVEVWLESGTFKGDICERW